MRTWIKSFRFGAVALVLLLAAGANQGHAQLKSGQEAPLFALKGGHDKSFELAQMRDQPMTILYFFDVDSSSSQEGLLHLDRLAKKYKEADLVVWGVTRAAKNKVSAFLSKTQLSFPVLLDSGKVSDIYSARLILPTVCIIGPDLKLLDYFQGGGKTTEDMLVTLAQRKLQRRQTELGQGNQQ